jgi:hypothetical protein
MPTEATAAIATVACDRGDLDSLEALKVMSGAVSKVTGSITPRDGAGRRKGVVCSTSVTGLPALAPADMVAVWLAAVSTKLALSLFAHGASFSGSGGRPCTWSLYREGQAIAGCQPKGSIVVTRQIVLGLCAVILTGLAVPMGGYEASPKSSMNARACI